MGKEQKYSRRIFFKSRRVVSDLFALASSSFNCYSFSLLPATATAMFSKFLTSMALLVTVSESSVHNVEEYNDVIFGRGANTLIVGGTETNIGDYTFTVGLRSYIRGRNFCAGSLIDRYHVLTAAHCINRDLNWVSVSSHVYSGTAMDSKFRLNQCLNIQNILRGL